MPQVTLPDVVRQMVRNACLQPDGSGLFLGSPRVFMEIRGESCSSGALYRGIYATGIERHGERKNGRWIIPAAIMRAFR